MGWPSGARSAGRLYDACDGAMLGGMIIVFEVHLAPGRSSDDFLSEELLEETQAQVMTPAEARAVGFEGVPDDPNLRLVAVAHRDRKFVYGALERAHDVVGFKQHEVDM
jgi:hypothetical protein